METLSGIEIAKEGVADKGWILGRFGWGGRRGGDGRFGERKGTMEGQEDV